MPVAERFCVLHNQGIYFGEQSLSGHASDDSQTKQIRSWLPRIVDRYEIGSLIDAPCGDCRWMAHIGFLETEYIGIDCVPSLIETNRKRFPGRKFECLDLLEGNLPEAELVLCRDLLIHLSNHDCQRALKRLATTNAKWIITTTFTGDRENLDIVSGDFRAVQLERPPFNLPPPAELCNEACTLGNGRFVDKSLGLWPMSALSRVNEVS